MMIIRFFTVALREDDDDNIQQRNYLEKSYEAGDEEDCGDDVAW